MTPSEEATLELLDNSGLELTASNIAFNIGKSGAYIQQLCNDMANKGLLEKFNRAGHPFYSITDRGRAYLDGEIDVDELEE